MGVVSCTRRGAAHQAEAAQPQDARQAWTQARQTFEHGDLGRAHLEADAAYQRFHKTDPAWASKLRLLDAEVLLWTGDWRTAAAILHGIPPAAMDRNLSIEALSLQGAVEARLHDFDHADRVLKQAETLCAQADAPACGGVMRSRGVLSMQRGMLPEAKASFARSLDYSRSHGDKFLEATALLNLSAESLEENHFDETIDWANEAKTTALQVHAIDIAQNAMGNEGWAHHGLGDQEKALDLLRQAESRAAELNDQVTRVSWITDSGYIYMDAGQYPLAANALKQALDLARGQNSHAGVFKALRALAMESEQAAQYETAEQYADQALAMARAEKNRVGEFYPLLVKGQVARHARRTEDAVKLFEEVERDASASAALRWQAQYGLAQLYEDAEQQATADAHYREALATVEQARAAVKRDESRLPFLCNAFSIYDSYIRFLVKQGKTEEALRWADSSRAQTLAEGHGPTRKSDKQEVPAINALSVARTTGATILFYWLGPKESYLWAVTPKELWLFPLPAESEIDEMVDDYNSALAGPQDVLESGNDTGQALYRMLVAPARDLIGSPAKVIVIPNGGLNSLNFETLIVSAPRPHYWIEDATLANGSSLRLLARLRAAKMNASSRLLLFGDTIAPSAEYPPLPNAAVEMASIARQFGEGKKQVYAREAATPMAYLGSGPERFSYIHFAAHGTANRLSPLDSAIVLSKGSAADDSFKLYARDIMQHPLHAELVTISTCYGAGTRTYPAEGMVGLSWAFLRAGAHNVVGALWEVSDVATAQLMSDFYGELDKGTTPDAALRAAKLRLLRSGGAFHRPFYWAPFQIYSGS